MPIRKLDDVETMGGSTGGRVSDMMVCPLCGAQEVYGPCGLHPGASVCSCCYGCTEIASEFDPDNKCPHADYAITPQ